MMDERGRAEFAMRRADVQRKPCMNLNQPGRRAFVGDGRRALGGVARPGPCSAHLHLRHSAATGLNLRRSDRRDAAPPRDASRRAWQVSECAEHISVK